MGSWRNDKQEGKGRLISPDGTTYEGEFKNGLPDGFGIQIGEGEEYTGKFLRGSRNGSGLLKRADGTTIEGEFSQGVQEGRGRVTKPDGSTKYGEWEDGKHKKWITEE